MFWRKKTVKEAVAAPVPSPPQSPELDAAVDGAAAILRALGRHAFPVVTDQPMALMLLDVDHFKAVNDAHGHPGGDAVLRSVANALARSFPRRSDIVARYGGEEFAVVLTDTGSSTLIVSPSGLSTRSARARRRMAAGRSA